MAGRGDGLAQEVDDLNDLEAGRQSLRAFARALAAVAVAGFAGLWLAGNAVAVASLPWLLVAASLALALSVWRIDARPKNTWRGMALGAIVMAVGVAGQTLM